MLKNTAIIIIMYFNSASYIDLEIHYGTATCDYLEKRKVYK